MDLLNILFEEIKSFFSLEGLVHIVQSGDYSALRTWEGVTKAISPLIPLILVLEISIAFFNRKIHTGEYRIPFLIYVFNRFVGRFITFGVVAFCIGWLQPLALFNISWTWYGFIVAYIAWEFAHFIYHFLAHKVRLFWCLHSTHHAPEKMNLSVTYAHFLLEAPYADFIRTSICILVGVPPEMLFVIMFIDGTWGAFIHIGAHIIEDASMGWIGKLILTPSHHRVHHARNPLYMDTNFCNLLNVWDRVFKTYQPEKRDINIEYGITRTIDSNSFWDVYFGEIYYLIKDVIRAPGILNKMLYVIMPPGWSHDGNHKTASSIRKNWLINQP